MSQSFIRGAAILGFATLFCKILGAAYRIPYQNITGNEGMFIYQQVYPLYSTLLAIATAGLPVAISKIVSERLAMGDELGAKKVMKFSMLTLFIIGSLFFCLLFFGAGILAGWMGNRQLLTLPIQTVSFALLLVPVAAAIRGYFQGKQDMFPTAISQSIEQFIRVCTILFLSWYLMDMGFGILYASAGAIFGAVIGAVAAIIVLLIYLMKEKKMKLQRLERSSSDQPKESYGKMMKKILLLSFPICMGALVIPLFSLVDAFTVANVLTEKIGSQAAVIYKGVFDRGQPLIQFAAFFATSLSLSIVPAIAEARAKQDEQEAKERARLAIRITWLTGLPAAIGLSIIAMPTNVMLFKDDLGSDALAIVALSVIFLTLNMTSTGILQGFGKVYLPAITLLIGAVIKWIGNLLLIPWFDIKGAAIATVVSYAIATFFNFLALRKIGVSLKSSGFLKKLMVAVSLMTGVTYVTMESVQWFVQGIPLRLEMTVTVFCSIPVAIYVFIWAIFRFKVVTLMDLEQLPSLKKRIVPILYKWRLLRS